MYTPYYFNPNFAPNNNYLSPQMNRLQQMEQQYQGFSGAGYPQNNMQMMNPAQISQGPMMIQGKVVDSIEVVKAMDVPLDGSITYFPKADGTAIYTKQLQKDGTSKINMYEIKNEANDAQVNLVGSSVSKEDIEKIYDDISEVKKSLDESMSGIIKRFDDFKEDFNKEIVYKAKLNNRGGK